MSLSTAACLVLFSGTVAVSAEVGHNPANTIQLYDDHPDSFRNFAPELPKLHERITPVNTAFGLHVSEIEPSLFLVSDLIYQSAFLVTNDGVVVFDAPPSIGERLRTAIENVAPGVPITHLIMTHGHSDHNGGGFAFADLPDLRIIAAQDVAASLKNTPLRGVLQPTQTFEETLKLNIGGVPIELQTTTFHAEDTDTMIYLPEQKFLMAVDTITPGEVPFMNFGSTSNPGAYFGSFETFLAYDFKHFLSGHVSVLGTRDDVIATRDYAWDVRDTVVGLMPSFQDRFMTGMQAVEFQNGNLAYRYAIESVRDECTARIIDRWENQLSATDIWASSHCETTVLYFITH
jgi:glyoxylase-like metal-dependent hydrolase (beta-lactamase superfamily II)